MGWGWVIPGDYNGDGKADILYTYRDNSRETWLALSNGDGTFTTYLRNQITGASGFEYENDSQLISGDYNGDGLTDVFCVKRNRTGNVNWVAFSTGTAKFNFVTPNQELQNPLISGWDSSHIVSIDFNGDGYDDLYHADAFGSTPIYSWVALSNGNGTFQYVSYSELGDLIGKRNDRNDSSRYFVGDFDGDGTADLLQFNRLDAHYLVQTRNFERRRVERVTNGHGGYTRFEYEPMTNPSVYTKGTAAV